MDISGLAKHVGKVPPWSISISSFRGDKFLSQLARWLKISREYHLIDKWWVIEDMVGMSYQHKSPTLFQLPERDFARSGFSCKCLSTHLLSSALPLGTFGKFSNYMSAKNHSTWWHLLCFWKIRGLRKGRKNWFAAYPMKFLSLCVNNTIYVSGWVLVGWVLRIWRHLCELALRWKSWPQILSPLATTISSLNHWFRMLKIAQTPALMI